MKKAVIYARYSSSSQNEQSIETQLDKCNEYAKANKLTVIKHYIDKGMTGTNANRPGFQEMINDARDRLFNVVIVYKLDRFARDEFDDIYYEKILNDNNIKRVSATETLPEDVFSNKLIKAITRLNNENYSRQLSLRINDGLDKNIEKGLMVGGSVTYGYDMIDKKYEINDKQAEVIRLIFNMYAENKSGKEIIETLNKKGMFNKNGKPFLNQHIFKILRNKRYIGIMTYKQIEYPNFLPPLIDQELFNTVQNKLSHAKNRHAHNSKVDYLLTGKLFCGDCGSKMTGYSGRGRHGKKFYYYKCHTCKKTAINKDYLEDMITNSTVNEIVKNEKLNDWIKLAVAVYNENLKTPDHEIKRITNKIAGITKQINNVLKAIKMGIITESTKSELENLEERKRILVIEKTKKEAAKPITASYDSVKLWFERFDKSKPSDDDKKDIIDALVNRIDLFDNYLNIYFNIGNHVLEKQVIEKQI